MLVFLCLSPAPSTSAGLRLQTACRKWSSAHHHKGSFCGAGWLYPPHRWRDGCCALPADNRSLSEALTPGFPAVFLNLNLACVCVTAAQRRNGAVERQRATELRAAGSALLLLLLLEFTVLLRSDHVWSSDKELERKANRGKRCDFTRWLIRNPLCLVAAWSCLIFLVLLRGEISGWEVLGFALQGRRSSKNGPK